MPRCRTERRCDVDGEWTLVLLTTLSQMAVGTFLLLSVLLLLGGREIDSPGRKALFATGLVLAAALLASIFHLRSPLNAYKMLNNLETSWLSREILALVLFLGTGGLFAVIEFSKRGSPRLRALVATIAAVMGVGLIYCMARVYMLRTVPAWNSSLTLATFFSTAFLLGAVTLCVAYRNDAVRLKRLAVAGIVILVARILIAVATSNSAGWEASEGLVQSVEPERWLILFQGALLLLGGACLGAVRFRREAPALLVQGAFLFLFVSELLGRFLFYECP